MRFVTILFVCAGYTSASARVCSEAADVPMCPSTGDVCRLALASQAVYECDDAISCDRCFQRLGWSGAVHGRSKRLSYVVTWTDKDVLLVFRGPGDYRDNADWQPEAFDSRAGPIPLRKLLDPAASPARGQYLWFHGGLLTAAQTAFRRVVAEVGPRVRTARRKRLLLAGHGAGGAVAKITAWLFTVRRNQPIAAVHTFGAPHVGGVGWSEAAELNGLQKVVHEWRFGAEIVPGASVHEAFRSWLRKRAADSGVSGFQPVGRCHWLGTAASHAIAGYVERVRELPAQPAPRCTEEW